MKKFPVILLFVALAGFIFGLVQLFHLRFEAGDIYPEYSSLRSDPLGAKALYESTEKLLVARRNYQPLSKLDHGRQTTLFYLGVEPDDLELTPAEWTDLQSFAGSGGRLVISLLPSYQKSQPNRFRPRATATATNTPTAGRRTEKSPRSNPRKTPADEDRDSTRFRRVSIAEQWRVQFDYAELQPDERGAHKPALAFRSDAPDLPESISCHTALFFANPDKSWRVIYARKSDRAVLIERRYGSGTIVLAADSYYFSNEALLKERQPELLAWLIGFSRRALFDETHLGVEESPGIAALGRKYRLHGLLAGSLLLAGLFLWKSSAIFVPPYEQEARREEPDLVAGKESAAGFVNLLRRNISSAELLSACITEWKRSCAHHVPRAKLERIQALLDAENSLPPKERKPIETYRSISRILSKSSAFRAPGSELGTAAPERAQFHSAAHQRSKENYG